MLDLSRSAITVALGTWEVAPAATFEAGAAVALDASGQVGVAADGATFFGVAKWNKTTALTAAIVAEQVILTAFALSNLKHAGLVSATERVTNLAGTVLYVKDTDYEISYTNGTINRKSGGAIPDGATVLVSYRYTLTTEELVYAGRNYMNLLDDTLGSGRITVIQDYAILYTDQYDTSKAYATSGATSLLTVDTGKFRPATGVEVVVAKVIAVPTASDQLLGIMLLG